MSAITTWSGYLSLPIYAFPFGKTSLPSFQAIRPFALARTSALLSTQFSHKKNARAYSFLYSRIAMLSLACIYMCVIWGQSSWSLDERVPASVRSCLLFIRSVAGHRSSHSLAVIHQDWIHSMTHSVPRHTSGQFQNSDITHVVFEFRVPLSGSLIC